MKRAFRPLASALLLVLGLAAMVTGEGSLTLDHVDGLLGPEQLTMDQPLGFHLRLSNNTDFDLAGFTNGFRVHSPDGAVWEPIWWDSSSALFSYVWVDPPGVWSPSSPYYDLVFSIKGFGVTGSGADTVGIGAAVQYFPGLPIGYDEIVFVLHTQVSSSDLWKQICLDSCWFPPYNAWQWTPDGIQEHIPLWDGPHCWYIGDALGDYDGDGVVNVDDNCPNTHNPGQENPDGDLLGSACDNCPEDYNPDQADSDGDTSGDVCDVCPGYDDRINHDGDPFPDGCDNCPYDTNPDQADGDGDGPGDVCDNCPEDYNPDQTDADGDYVGDLCDTCTDIDDDGYGNPGYPANTCPVDNCPDVYNPDQADEDGDGIGDVCEGCCIPPIRGDVVYDGEPGEWAVDIADIVYLIVWFFKEGPEPPCLDEADLDANGRVTVADLVYLLNFTFKGGNAPLPCYPE